MPDGDRHSLTFADGRPRVDVAGEILVRAVKTERFALRSALQEVTTHHVLNTLSSPDSQRSHRFAIDDFIAWYCSEPRLALNKTVVLRYKLQLEARHYALGKLRTGLPDLIISDLNMPRMAGIELLEVVRKRFPQIPVIVISAVAADEMPEEVIADAYYHKNGFGFEPLLQTISNLIRKPPLRAAAPHVDNKTVLARWDGNGHYDVECPDCMRSTMVPRGPRFTRGEHVTTCIHCCGLIQLLINEGDSLEGRAA
jgi:CheY-like chemotaxis protein